MSSHTGVVPSREGEKLRGLPSPLLDPQMPLGPCYDPTSVTTCHNHSGGLPPLHLKLQSASGGRGGVALKSSFPTSLLFLFPLETRSCYGPLLAGQAGF